MRDPLFLTEANERLLEHFGRIAYANLRYNVPEKDIAGWKTDRGQTLIRFGLPQQRVRTRADLGTTPSGHITLNASREFWDYGDFQMIFDDRFLNRNYSFAWGSVGEVDGKWLFEQKIRETPERYVFPHGGRRLDLPHVIAQFRSPEDSASASSTRLEIYFGIPDSSVQAMSGRNQPLVLRRGLFFFDENWNEIRQWREDRQLIYLADMDSAAAPNSSDHLLDRWSVRMPPGAYHVSLEVVDKNSGRSGAERKTITVEDFSGASLRMSNVVLANTAPKISGEENSGLALYQNGEVNFVPCLSYRFAAATPIHVYYEVYNLALAANGQSRYRIDYVVESQQEAKSLVSRAVDRIGKLLGKGARPIAITSSFESAGDQRLEKLYHSIAMLGHPAGPYDLTIRLTDQISGQSAERRVTFEIAK
ncbi:GWxTD domain-containing protein [candidate division KSB1 bacterium]|nr:GWxTD domain-containing protein [candidate division KSB1 bacterium]